jgi:hypothetical protein
MLGRAWVRVVPIATLINLARQSVLTPSSPNFNISRERFTRIRVGPLLTCFLAIAARMPFLTALAGEGQKRW